MNEGHLVRVDFLPLDWVRITVAGIGLPGRVSACKLEDGHCFRYEVEYIGTDGQFKDGWFRADEIRLDDKMPRQVRIA